MVTEFQTKKEKFDQEAGTMSSTVRQYREKELVDLQQRIMEFQEGVQSDMQEKQLELMQPFQDKILKAIEEVAKENGYAYMANASSTLSATSPSRSASASVSMWRNSSASVRSGACATPSATTLTM